jgi:outer membrane receptor for ferrienterochelin and colicin
MRPFIKRILAVAFLALVCPSLAGAQGNPTGVIRGVVNDPDSLALPGVTVTVSSPALQGVRTTVTSGTGEFIIPFLPPGEYTVLCELEGFEAQRRTIGVAMAETIPIKVTLALAKLTETITVTGTTTTEVLKSGTIAQTFKAEKMDVLPTARTLESAVLLAPGVTDKGPSGSIILSGALSFEGLFLINGADVNETLRGQPDALYVPDAIQETKISTGNISAEYGRFNGGVVNMITKSGGNTFSGSFRDTLTNDSWRSLRPLNDQKTDQIVPEYQGTFGGPIAKDKVWFFADGFYKNNKQTRTLDYTNLNYPYAQSDTRYEGKVTYTLNSQNSIKGDYTGRKIETTGNTSNGPIDLASLYNNGTDYGITVLNYTGAWKSNLFLETQYSSKNRQTNDTGATQTDLINGTLMLDRSRGSARFNSPTFCAVCGSGWHEKRNNWDAFAKLGYFLTTQNGGSHNIVGGFEAFKETRMVDNYQSGSSYRVYVTKSVIDPGAAATIYPVFVPNSDTYIEYDPLVQPSQGSDLRTYSGYANDQWRINSKMSLNLGVRYDYNNTIDQGGVHIFSDSQWSPRVGLSWDLRGDGKWIANAGFARYVMGINSAVADAGSAGGRTASYTWTYAGAPINAACSTTTLGSCQTTAQALPAVWAWFNSIGGANNTKYRNAPSIPGVTTKVSDNTTAPSNNEITVGIAHELFSKGTVRVDYAYRTYADMYGSYTDMSTGTITDPTGRAYDATVVRNTPDALRWYHGVTSSVDFRLPRLTLGGNYTLAFNKGNNNGENTSSGPIMASINQFPEYKAQSWNWPTGWAMNDQRHKARAYLTWQMPVNPAAGNFSAGIIQRFDSAMPYNAVIAVDSLNYVTNPGYLKAPATVDYFVAPRGTYRMDNIFATDLSFNWSKAIHRSSEVFFRAVLLNVLNRQGVNSFEGVDTTVSSYAAPGSYAKSSFQPFNPFTTVPVEGVNWRLGPSFGQPISPDSYQTPRTFNCSFGIRF